MTQPQVEERLKALATIYVEPEDLELNRYLPRLDKMVNFYTDKIPQAPQAQGLMFRGFTNALLYAYGVIKSYKHLTHELKQLTQEIEDENRTSS